MNWRLPQLDVATPGWFSALLLSTLIVLGWRYRLTVFSSWRQAASLAMRLLFLFLITLALADVRVVTNGIRAFVVLAVDRSASVDGNGRKAADAFVQALKRLADPRQVTLLEFASEPVLTQFNQASRCTPSRTDIAAAIERASVCGDPHYAPHVVLLSDGNQTQGDALQAAKTLDSPVSTIPLPSWSGSEVSVDSVQMPGQARYGDACDVDVTVTSDHPDKGVVRWMQGGRTVDSRAVLLQAGENHVRFVQKFTGPDGATFHAEITGCRDTLMANNVASAVVFFAPPPRVLVVGDQPLEDRRLAKAMHDAAVSVSSCRPDELPQAERGLREFDLIMLDNVSADSLGPPRMKALRAYIEQLGGGLIAVGGNRAFYPGGYSGTSLESILPVTANAESLQQRPSLALVLVMDRSESMAGTKLAMAKLAAVRAIRMLDAKDQLGVVAFNEDSKWVVDLANASESLQTQLNLDEITAEGKTRMYVALDQACRALKECTIERKHLILLSDGLSPEGDYSTLVGQMAQFGITVSTVALGDKADQALLTSIARGTGGHSYLCRDADSLPDILAEDTIKAGRLGVVQGTFAVTHADDSTWPLARVRRSMPPVLGYDCAAAKAGSQVVLKTQAGDPLLVWWRLGQGMSAAFLSESDGDWAEQWTDWSEFDTFWKELVHFCRRKKPPLRFDLCAMSSDLGARIQLDATDDEHGHLSGLVVTCRVTSPDGSSLGLDMRPTAPGSYAGDVAVSAAGTYRIDVEARDKGKLCFAGACGFVTGHSSEYCAKPVNQELLRKIADKTGGAYDPSPEAIVKAASKDVRCTASLWPGLLAAALVVLVADVAVRRVVWRANSAKRMYGRQ